MKRIIIVIFLLVSSQNLFAQKISFGVKGGMNFSTLPNSGTSQIFFNPDYIPGLNFYLISDLYTKNIFTFGAEAGFIQKGYRLEMLEINEFGDQVGDGHINYTTNYISIGIPSKIKYNMGNINPYAVLSPRVDFYTGYKTSTKGFTKTTDSLITSIQNPLLEEFKNTILGFSAGAGVEIKSLIPATIIVESRYLFDLNNSFDNSFLVMKNRSWEFNVGVRF
jgi:hypothetical protein